MEEKAPLYAGRDEILGECGCLVEWTLYTHRFEFQVTRVIGRKEGSDEPLFANRLWFNGNIRWDGCVDIQYGNGISLNHYCGPDDLILQAKAIEWIYRKAAEEGAAHFELEDWAAATAAQAGTMLIIDGYQELKALMESGQVEPAHCVYIYPSETAARDWESEAGTVVASGTINFIGKPGEKPEGPQQ